MDRRLSVRRWAAYTLARRICRIMTLAAVAAVSLGAVALVVTVELAGLAVVLAAAVGLARRGAVLVMAWQRVWQVLLAAPPLVELQKY